MKFIQGTDRTQVALFPVTLKQSIYKDNEVRIIDLFVAYNIRRIINILGKNELKKYLEVLILLFLSEQSQIRAILSRYNKRKFFSKMFFCFF